MQRRLHQNENLYRHLFVTNTFHSSAVLAKWAKGDCRRNRHLGWTLSSEFSLLRWGSKTKGGRGTERRVSRRGTEGAGGTHIWAAGHPANLTTLSGAFGSKRCVGLATWSEADLIGPFSACNVILRVSANSWIRAPRSTDHDLGSVFAVTKVNAWTRARRATDRDLVSVSVMKKVNAWIGSRKCHSSSKKSVFFAFFCGHIVFGIINRCNIFCIFFTK